MMKEINWCLKLIFPSLGKDCTKEYNQVPSTNERRPHLPVCLINVIIVGKSLWTKVRMPSSYEVTVVSQCFKISIQFDLQSSGLPPHAMAGFQNQRQVISFIQRSGTA